MADKKEKKDIPISVKIKRSTYNKVRKVVIENGGSVSIYVDKATNDKLKSNNGIQ